MSAVLTKNESSYVLYDSTTAGRSNRDAGKLWLPIINVPLLPSSIGGKIQSIQKSIRINKVQFVT
jgi:hypothetical protein